MRLRRPVIIAAILSVALASSGLAATATAAEAPVELVLSVVGDGSAPLATTPTAVSLVTISSDGTAAGEPVVALPTAASGANQAFTLSGDSSAIGQLALAADGSSLAIAGYSAAPGNLVGDPKDSTAAAAPRVVASIAADGTVDTSTVLTGAYSQDHPRSVATVDGTSFYVSGNGTDKAPAAGVVLAQRGSTAAPTAIAAAPINARNVTIAAGQLYSSSGAAQRGIWKIGEGTPTSAATGTRLAAAASGTAASLYLVDTDTVVGADTAYVVMEGTGIAKWALVGSTWTAEGVAAGNFQAVTGRFAGGAVELFAIQETSAGNSVVAVTDTAASAAPIALGSPTTIATAAPNTAFRGVALAPTGWDPVAGEEPEVPAALPVATVNPEAASTVVGTGPVTATVSLAAAAAEDGDSEVDPATFDVDVTSSSNTAVAQVSDVVLAGTGSERTLTVTPAGVGITTITLAITDPATEAASTATFAVGVSAATPGLTGVNYHAGSADASTAIALDEEYMLVADDESNTIRLYDRYADGEALREYDFSDQLGTTKEVDLEASARVGNTIYWFASHGNNKDSEYKSARSVFFTTTISGEGAGTELAFGGAYTGIRTGLLAWDAANDNSLGLATACSLDGGTHPDQTTGCNIEGFEFAPDGETGLIGFRSPRVDGKAVVVPVGNVTELPGTTTAPAFGEPILLDLGGRTIRELRANAAGDYLITAGAPDDAPLDDGWALYRWDGLATSDAVFVAALPGTGDAIQESGSYESIVEVPTPLVNGSKLQLLTDNGTTVFYADGVEGKDVSPAGLLKFRSNVVTLDDVEAPAPPPLVEAGSVTVSGTRAWGNTLTATATGWSPSTATLEYQWYRDGVRIVGATAASYTLKQRDAGTTTTVVVTGSAEGYEPATASSTGAVIPARLTTTPTPTIAGTATTGRTLRAVPGSWKPAGVTLSYRWKRDGVNIPGAIASRYVLTKADSGHRVTVTVTGTKKGYTSVVKTSAPLAVR